MSTPVSRRYATGVSAIVFAIVFNIPYGLLAAQYSYPEILRRPASEALDRFAEGGPTLVLIWYAFALAALAFVPVSMALSVTPKRLIEVPALSLGALLAGALAGVTQAIGLMRWVFVVPGLADLHAAPDATPEAQTMAESSFSLINAYGGVAIGEHMGQLLTALFVGLMATMQWNEGRRITASTGFVTTAAITFGAGEGIALALKSSGDLFSMATIVGFLGLTLWLILTGIGLIRKGDA